MWSRVTSYKKGRADRGLDTGATLSDTQYERKKRCAIGKQTSEIRFQTSEIFGDSRRTSDVSHLVVSDARGLVTIIADVRFEIGEQRDRLALQDAQTGDRHAPDLELGALAAAQLEHRAPGPRVRRDDDLHFGRVGQDAA